MEKNETERNFPELYRYPIYNGEKFGYNTDRNTSKFTGDDTVQAAVGKSISNRIATGRLSFYHRVALHPSTRSSLSRQEEVQRFQTAQRQSVLELAELYDRAFDQVGVGTASIFAIHAMLLEDEDFVAAVMGCLRKASVTAEYAVQCACLDFASSFAAMADPYMRARAVDIRDIARRMIRQLMGLLPEDPLAAGPAILVCDEFLPSEVMELDRSRLLGLISQHGSVDSHAAMLLQAYSIPAIAGVQLDDRWNGHQALLDGHRGRLYCDPDASMLNRLAALLGGGVEEDSFAELEYG